MSWFCGFQRKAILQLNPFFFVLSKTKNILEKEKIQENDERSNASNKKPHKRIKSFYSSLKNCRLKAFPSGIVWNPWVPMKVSSLTWEVV